MAVIDGRSVWDADEVLAPRQGLAYTAGGFYAVINTCCIRDGALVFNEASLIAAYPRCPQRLPRFIPIRDKSSLKPRFSGVFILALTSHARPDGTNDLHSGASDKLFTPFRQTPRPVTRGIRGFNKIASVRNLSAAGFPKEPLKPNTLRNT